MARAFLHPSQLSLQVPLFRGREPQFDASFHHLQRTELGQGAWIDLARGWLAGDADLFATLEQSVRWRRESRRMYERVVEVPRLYAVLPSDGPVPDVVSRMCDTLNAHYAAGFDRISIGYYRDGRDSVAWHGDYVARRLPEALVATVSLGGSRKFFLRPKGGGERLTLSLGSGDLLVMGGTCQRTHEHCIPKAARADARMALMFRPTWTKPQEADDDAEEGVENAARRRGADPYG